MSRFARVLSCCLMVLALAGLAMSAAGCSIEKKADAKATVLPPEDRLRTRNDDILYGKLQGDSFVISSPYFKQVTLQRAEIREIAFEPDQDVVRTRRGDVLRGRVDAPTFRFQARIGVAKDFQRSELKWIELHD